MDTVFLIKGVIIGFSIAAPVGPIGILCIRRTLSNGRLIGFVSGIGAATADALYGCIAGFGLTAVSHFLLGYQFWLRVIGGLFLCYLAAKTFNSKPAENGAKVEGNGLISSYISIFFLTITNPMTILSFTAVFVGLGLSSTNSFICSSLLVAGVFTGSALWWLTLSIFVGFLRNAIDRKWMVWINRLSGLIIGAFGIGALVSLLKYIF